MKNKSFYSIIIFAFIIIVFLSYKTFNEERVSFSKSKYIKELNTTLFLSHQKTFSMLKDFNYLWGVTTPKKVKKKKKKKSTKIIQKNNQICINKDCYRFLGLYYKKDKIYITFYSKKFKKRIKDFSIGEELARPLYIDSYKNNRLYIKDQLNKKIWYFDFFNVNASKYKPKDINESNF